MARFNEILVGRYNRFLQKLLQMKGGPPSPQLSSEISVSFVLFNGAENRYLEGWNRFAIVLNAVAPPAGQRAGIRLRNPSGSNVIVVIEQVMLGSTLADTPLLELTQISTDLTTLSNVVGRVDSRHAQKSSTVLSKSDAATGAVLTQQIMQWFIPAGISQAAFNTENQELPVLPGDALSMYCGNLAQAFQVSLLWRERMLEESERA
jgi:hypothetical protein